MLARFLKSAVVVTGADSPDSTGNALCPRTPDLPRPQQCSLCPGLVRLAPSPPTPRPLVPYPTPRAPRVTAALLASPLMLSFFPGNSQGFPPTFPCVSLHRPVCCLPVLSKGDRCMANFSLAVSCALLEVDPKTLRRWLRLAHWSPRPDPLDARN